MTQKRNVNVPGALARPAVSKTMSYAPGAGRIAPATRRVVPNESMYGLITSGEPGVARQAVLVAGVHDERFDLGAAGDDDPEVRDRAR